MFADSNTTKTTRHSNHDDKIPDNAGYYRIMSSPDNHMQPEMPRKGGHPVFDSICYLDLDGYRCLMSDRCDLCLV